MPALDAALTVASIWSRANLGIAVVRRRRHISWHSDAAIVAPVRVAVEIREWSAFMIAVRLAGFGNQVEVVSPHEVRAELARIGTELRDTYT